MIIYYKVNIIGCQKVNGLGDDFIMHKTKIKNAYYLQKEIRELLRIFDTPVVIIYSYYKQTNNQYIYKYVSISSK